MKFLSNTFFTPNSLAAHIIANLGAYSQLVDLHIYGLMPEKHIWNPAPISLKTLEWEIPDGWSNSSPWNIAQFLVNVVEPTRLDLESLEVSLVDVRYAAHKQLTLSTVPAERAQQYRNSQTTTSAKLTRLRYFGFSYKHSPTVEEVESPFLNFVDTVEPRYKHPRYKHNPTYKHKDSGPVF